MIVIAAVINRLKLVSSSRHVSLWGMTAGDNKGGNFRFALSIVVRRGKAAKLIVTNVPSIN